MTLPAYALQPPAQPAITVYAGDSGPTLRLRVVDDLQNPVDLTGATARFIVRTPGGFAYAIPPGLSTCTALPNPPQLLAPVIQTGVAVTVPVDTQAGLTAGPLLVGIPNQNQELVTLSFPDSGHVSGTFAYTHAAREPVVMPGVASPDPVYNARNGYVLYAWPAGAPAVPGVYVGQLVVTFPSGAVQHGPPVAVLVQEGA